MDDHENTSQSASKRHKSEEVEEDEVAADEQKTSSDSQSSSTNNNDSGLVTTADLGTSLSFTSDLQEVSPNAIQVGESGLDTAGNVTAEEMPPSCSVTNQGGGDDVQMNNSKTNQDANETTSVKNCQNRSQKNSKSYINRNRLTFLSSSSDDENTAGGTSAEVNPPNARTAPESGVDVSVEEDQTHIGPIASESIPSTEPRNNTPAEATATGEASGIANASSENGSATNRANRRTLLRRGRGNRATGRNYRNRWASPSSSSSDERPVVVIADNQAGGSSPDVAELPSNDNDQSESSEMDISSADSTESDSQNILRRNLYMDSSSDSDSNTDEQMNDSMNEEANIDQTDDLQDVLNKPKPIYTWNSTYELMRREHGLTGNGRYSLRNGMSPGFNTRFYSSRHVVERMKLLHCLRKHTGCVNCLNFNRSGNLLCTGSDDMRVVIWDWAQNKVKHSYKSGHTENIFQTKFIEFGSGTGLDIVSAGRDGQVRRAIVPPSGAKASTTFLYKHKDSVHKLVVCPQTPTEIISVGEDGYVRHYDLRKSGDKSDVLKVVKANNRKVRLFSISHHPFNPEICVCGCDRFVRVYDKRNMSKTVHEMCPQQLLDTSIPQVTCSVYNNTGSEILSSYGDDHIYLFNNKVYNKGEYLHRYRGHYNHKTIKGVNFFGPNSEYVISGSDCSNIFFWDKNTEAILNFMPGDTMGVVNCLEPHPSIPILATSGLDPNIKIWTPNSEIYPPDLSKLGDRVKRNLRRSVIEEINDIDDHQFQYFMRQFIRQPRGRMSNRGFDSNNVPESQSSSSSSSEDDYPRLEAVHCRTQ